MPARTPLPHQAEALAWAKRRPRIALFMEMRLGKTLVAIRWAKSKPVERVLVVSPLSTLTSWREELALEGEASTMLTGPKRLTKLQEVSQGLSCSQRHWFLTNPESVITRGKKGNQSELLEAEDWDCIIVDESTRIKNPKAKLTKTLLRYAPEIKHRAILSGKPNPEGPLDFCSQFLFLDGNFLLSRNYWDFRKEYFRTDYTGFNWAPKPGALQDIKEWVHDRAFVKLRKQCNIGSQKIYEKRTVPMNAAQRRLQKTILDEYRAGEKETQHIIVTVTWLARVAGGFDPDTGKLINDGKIRELLDLLGGELRDEKVLVWFRFNSEIEAVAQALRAKMPHVHFGVITGEVDNEERAKLRHSFNTSPGLDVLLVQQKCGRFGLDLSASSTAIYYSNGYSHEDRSQSEDRIIHPKKTEPVLCLDLVSEGSLDVEVIKAVREKQQISERMLIENFFAGAKDVLRDRN